MNYTAGAATPIGQPQRAKTLLMEFEQWSTTVFGRTGSGAEPRSRGNVRGIRRSELEQLTRP